MKNQNLFIAAVIFSLSLVIGITACCNDEDSVALNFGPNETPHGQSFEEWAVDWTKYVMSKSCAANPLNDPTGSYANEGQAGDVFFLVGTTGGAATRDVTIHANTCLFFPVINYVNDHPCPDPDFQLAAGQSLEDFLHEGAMGFIDLATSLEITLDGVALTNLQQYRYTTDLFYFTGNPDLANCLDPCVTGKSQAAVVDGYWMMLRALAKGHHTLHFGAEITDYGFEVDVTYNITVE